MRPARKAFSITALSVCLALLFCPQRARAQSSAPGESDDEPEANPARPTIATPATLTPVGYLQFETGVLGAADSPGLSSQVSFNEVIKLSVASRLELLAVTEPIAYTTSQGMGSNNAGDVFLGAQVPVFRGEGATPTIAVSYLRRAYGGAAPDLDIGSPVNSVLLLASADAKGFHYDANAIFNEMTEGPVRRAQFGQTISISHPIVGKFSLTGELWHFTQPFLRGNAVGNLWALGYTPRKTLVLDAGFDHGFTSTSTHWEAFAGFTYLVPHRLWPK